MNNYYVANFFSIVCQYCRIRPIFVETRVEQKMWTFLLDHGVKVVYFYRNVIM